MSKAETDVQTASATAISESQRNKVLRNAYLALAMTFGVSAFVSSLVLMGVIVPSGILSSPLFVFAMNIGFLIGIHAFRNSALGFGLLLAFGGSLGLTLSPVIMQYTTEAPQLVTNAFFATVVLFASLSIIATQAETDFTRWSRFLGVGLLVVIGLGLVGYYTSIPVSHSLLSGLVLLIASGMTICDTQNALRNPNANYLVVAVSLFLNIINMFMSLLQLLGSARE